MRPVRGLVATAIAALLVAAGAAGCGVPIDNSPEPLEVPPQYQHTATTGPPEVTNSGELTALLCLTREQRLVKVTRRVEESPSPQELLVSLMDGPTEAEARDEGVTSALTGIRTIGLAGVEQGIAEITVGDGLDGITAENRLLIYGQIVCTLDGHTAVTGVRFSRDGQPLPVPRGNATVTTDVLTTDDYADLLEST